MEEQRRPGGLTATKPAHAVPATEVLERARPRSYSATYKARILAEYDGLDKAGKGALLRREGLYSSLVSEWRKQRERGGMAALAQSVGRPPADPRDRAIARLDARCTRLEQDLTRARQVIDVQGKLSALLEQLATSSAPMPGGEPR